jgi:LytS/YehU family sensor histidine kinase
VKLLTKYKRPLLGALIGVIGGYTYYYFVGCSSGSCMITSRPFNSSIYGALLGALLFADFEKKQTINHTENEKQ